MFLDGRDLDKTDVGNLYLKSNGDLTNAFLRQSLMQTGQQYFLSSSDKPRSILEITLTL
jgi:hypothetical protein